MPVMKKIVAVLITTLPLWLSVSATTTPVADISTHDAINSCAYTGSITVSNVHNAGTNFFLDAFNINVYDANDGNFSHSLASSSVGNGGSVTFNMQFPGSYRVVVDFAGVFDHGRTVYSCSFSNQYTCPAPQVSGIRNATSPACHDGAIFMNNGDVFSNIAPGTYTFTANAACGCGGISYTVNATVGSIYQCTPPVVTGVTNTSSPYCSDGVVYMSNGDVFNGLAPGTQTISGNFLCYCGNVAYSVSATVGATDTCKPPTVASVTGPSTPLINNGVVVMSNGDVFSGLPAGYQAISGNYSCGCGSLPYTVFPTLTAGACNFDFSAKTTDPIFNCANGSVLITSTNAPGSQYYTASVFDSSNSLITSGTFNPGDIPYKISLPQSGAYSVKVDAYASNGATCPAVHGITIGPAITNFFRASYAQTDISAYSCSDGSITITTNNDNDIVYQSFWAVPYQYNFTYALYDSSSNVIATALDVAQHTFTGLAPGSYTATTTGIRYDAQSCPSSVSQLFIINKPPLFTLTTSSTGLTYKYKNDGTITASIDNYGGDCNAHIDLFDTTNTLVNQWSAAAGSPGPTTFANLKTGVYRVEAHGGTYADTAFVTVADGGCDFSAANFVIAQAPALDACNGLQLKYNTGNSSNYTFGYRKTASPFNAGLLAYNAVEDVYEASSNLPTGNYIITGHYGVCADSTVFNYIAHTLPVVSLAGPTCLGSGLLKLTTNGTGIQSIAWKLNDSTVQTSTSGFGPNGLTVAGGNGPGTDASQVYGAHDVFTDAQGNLYVAELYNARITKWAPGATEGLTVASSPSPSGIFVDGGGNLYVAVSVAPTVADTL